MFSLCHRRVRPGSLLTLVCPPLVRRQTAVRYRPVLRHGQEQHCHFVMMGHFHLKTLGPADSGRAFPLSRGCLTELGAGPGPGAPPPEVTFYVRKTHLLAGVPDNKNPQGPHFRFHGGRRH